MLLAFAGNPMSVGLRPFALACALGGRASSNHTNRTGPHDEDHPECESERPRRVPDAHPVRRETLGGDRDRHGHHGTQVHDAEDHQDGLRRIDPQSGEVLERLKMPAGTMVSGLESDGSDQLVGGGGASGKVRSVRRPKRADAGVRPAEVSATS